MTKAEKYIKNYTKNCSNECELKTRIQDKEITWFQPWLTPDHALAAVAIERKELLDKVCEWLLKNTFKSDWPSSKIFVEYFRKAMEE